MKPEYNLKKMKIKRRGTLPAFRKKAGSHSKIRITILLDQDILEYFKSKADTPGTLPYQTQINHALRNLMNQTDIENIKEIKKFLLNDKDFINKLAKIVNKK